ncbi:MAG: dipeptide/oligopeptide/nickel ABC transporter ATP-binding protein, partial [Novibacillus thermophilus]
MSGERILEVQKVKKYFRVGRGENLRAVDNVSFHVHKGETFGLVGESGCGKSTIGRTIIRLYDATAGKVLFKGRDVHGQNRQQMQQFRREVQMIFQDPYASLNPRMTVEDIVAEGLDIHRLVGSKSERRKRVQELLEIVGLNPEHLSRYPHEFSGGQRQRIGIA